jgi:putative component of toxin-antitoxin plasmid stabilization module
MPKRMLRSGKAKRRVVLHEDCLQALEIVAREGWLCKEAWSISKAVHAYAKPTRIVLGQAASPAISRAVLQRLLITSVKTRNHAAAPKSLPAGLRELTLSEDAFSGAVPGTLTALTVTDCSDDAAAALRSLLQALPSTVQTLNLRVKRLLRADLLDGTLCSAGVRTLKLRGLGWRMQLPQRLVTLHMWDCGMDAQLQLPATVRQLLLGHCISAQAMQLNEGLLRVELTTRTVCYGLLELPSTLTHLLIGDDCHTPLAQPLPAALRQLRLGDR